MKRERERGRGQAEAAVCEKQDLADGRYGQELELSGALQ